MSSARPQPLPLHAALRSGRAPRDERPRTIAKAPHTTDHGPPRRPGRAWGRAAFALVVALGVGVAWLASRGRTDPDRLWADAERAFLAGQWDRARASLQ